MEVPMNEAIPIRVSETGFLVRAIVDMIVSLILGVQEEEMALTGPFPACF
jgi:hypothetical protein